MAKPISFTNTLLAIALCSLTIACEKPVFDDEEIPTGTESTKGDFVKISFGNFSTEQRAFNQSTNKSPQNNSPQSRANAPTPISELCTRINFALFDSETGEKIKSINQTTKDASFGNISLNIPKGSYVVVVVAHNGDGNATLSSPEKITFKDNKITDTFYYYNTIDVDEASSYDMTMKRAVAMFQLVLKDNTPSDVKTMKFYYTGGSSTFNAATGYGCVNSKQTELRSVGEEAYSNGSTYDIYTFPHEEEKKLKVEISALSSASNSNVLFSKTINNVKITRNYVSRYSGYFFNADPENSNSFTLTTTDEWQYEDYEY